MFDLRKTLGFPYISIKFLWIIFAVLLLGLISDTLLMVSTALVFILATGFFGTLLNQGSLKSYNKKTWYNILHFSGIFILITIIFFIIEGIIVLIGFIPFYLVTQSESIISPAVLVITSIILFIFLIAAGIIELAKSVALVKYFSNKKFETFFEIKQNLKVVWTKNFLVFLLFIFGYLIMYFLGMALIIVLLQALGVGEFGLYSVGAIVLLFCLFILSGAVYCALNEVIKNK